MTLYSISKLLVFTILFRISIAKDYCSITCDGEKHTMCLFSGPSSSKCANLKYSDRGELRQQMLDLHNDFRNKFANQEFQNQKEKGFPKASNMNQLYWDDELEEIAKRWAEQCEFKHDKCRNVERFHVGQNLGYQGSSRGDPASSANTFQQWVDEMKDADPSVRTSFKSMGYHAIGHFTQAAWADTMFVGCAEVLYEAEGMTRRYVACDYGPSGNVLEKPMYEEGEPCSQCRQDFVCGTKYKYLCFSPQEEEKSNKGKKRGSGNGVQRMIFKSLNAPQITIFALLAAKLL